MTTPGNTAAPAGGCGGDGCAAHRPWPLYHVRHRGALRRLCTSCVLKCHQGFFCTSCFEVLDGGSPSAATGAADARPAVVHCAKCPSVVHLACLPNPDLADHFVCPSCANPDGFSYFPIVGAGAAAGRIADRKKSAMTIDLDSAKVLLAAARLAAASMSRAAAAARVEAERKVKEAMVARKKAREKIEEALAMSKQRDKKRALVTMPEVTDPKKKKSPKLDIIDGATAMVGSKVQSRERDKWMRFQEPIRTMHVPGKGTSTNDKSKGASVSAEQTMELKDSKKIVSNNVKHEEEKKRLLSSLQIDSVKEEDKVSLGEGNKDLKKP